MNQPTALDLTGGWENIFNDPVRKAAADKRAAEEAEIRHDISNLDVSELRRIVPILKPDPTVILKLLGYTDEDIRKFKNS